MFVRTSIRWFGRMKIVLLDAKVGARAEQSQNIKSLSIL